ncbi:uncharacterized protein E0L32_006063 [Thyridium curvatum]|uniref:Succinate dehydrogenase assembly factor 4, mitochondrial n=1 Tax=Thyridium curvatum TaxID=1093900 RepID=A0A507AUE0_9PEZI|nr:uncharacterized protein E0L32_006063 [Thyridium curvatum]TPX13592.1 hypothetical protein E0L32_006063 [Thyridium curvatum]
MPIARTTPILRLLRPRIPRRTALTSSTTTVTTTRLSSTFQQGPSPPRLPAAQQAEFERLQRASAERLGIVDDAGASTTGGGGGTTATSTSRHTTSASSAAPAAAPAAAAADTSTHEGVWRGAPPEFEGDTNPKTGEVGGPKNEPLRWGSAGDWSYNGRVTDF